MNRRTAPSTTHSEQLVVIRHDAVILPQLCGRKSFFLVDVSRSDLLLPCDHFVTVKHVVVLQIFKPVSDVLFDLDNCCPLNGLSFKTGLVIVH